LQSGYGFLLPCESARESPLLTGPRPRKDPKTRAPLRENPRSSKKYRNALSPIWRHSTPRCNTCRSNALRNLATAPRPRLTSTPSALHHPKTCPKHLRDSCTPHLYRGTDSSLLQPSAGTKSRPIRTLQPRLSSAHICGHLRIVRFGLLFLRTSDFGLIFLVPWCFGGEMPLFAHAFLCGPCGLRVRKVLQFLRTSDLFCAVAPVSGLPSGALAKDGLQSPVSVQFGFPSALLVVRFSFGLRTSDFGLVFSRCPWCSWCLGGEVPLSALLPSLRPLWTAPENDLRWPLGPATASCR